MKGDAHASHKFTSLFSLNNNQVSSLGGLHILILVRNPTSTRKQKQKFRIIEERNIKSKISRK